MGILYTRNQFRTDVSFVTVVFLSAVVVARYSEGTTEDVRTTLNGILLAFGLTDLALAPILYQRFVHWRTLRRMEREDDLRRYSSD